MKTAFAKTINEMDLGITASSVMSECEQFGMAYGCNIDCPVLRRGECDLMHDENAELYAQCLEENQ